jgi:hypothetical protein
MGMRFQTNKIYTAGACILVTAAMFFATPVALARHPFILWMDGLIVRFEPRYREMIIWDYEGGRTTGSLQIPGSLDLQGFKVGDFVRARVALNYHLLLGIERPPPPVGDEHYQKALRRLESETGDQAP